MSPIPAGSLNQALVTAAIDAANKALKNHKNHRKYVGRTAVQKIAYFMQVSGVPLTYQFDIYHYGPYSEQLCWDVDELLVYDILTDDSKEPRRYSSYTLGEKANELLSRHSDALAKYEPTICAVVNALMPFEPDRLELAATIDFVYRQLRAQYPNEDIGPRVVNRVLELKNGKFSRDDVHRTYAELVAAGQ